MTWVRIDDQFPDHPKIAAAGPLAGWLHVCGLCYCNRHLTDGFIPRAVAHRLTNYEHIGLETGGVAGLVAVGSDVDCVWMASVLCEVGVWKEVPGGYQIHDYGDYQPTRAEVEAAREQRRQAGSRGGLAKAKRTAKRGAKRPAKQVAKQTSSEMLSETPSKTLPQARTQEDQNPSLPTSTYNGEPQELPDLQHVLRDMPL